MKNNIFSIHIVLLLITSFVHYQDCQRRITGGSRVKAAKRYMVYIIWHITNEGLPFYKIRNHDVLCGGVIIKPQFILTSAACLGMKPLLYVVGGYRQYIPNDDDKDPCIAISQRKIIWKCFLISLTPTTYNDKAYYENASAWTNSDVAVAKLNKAYDFTDKTYSEICSYIPNSAKLNFDKVVPGTQVVVFGWGSDRYQRPEGYHYDISQQYMKSASTVVLDNTKTCKDSYDKVNVSVARKICTQGPGQLDANGTLIKGSRRSMANDSYEDEPLYVVDKNQVIGNNNIIMFNTPQNTTRRNGPCQNDHGGPLVTWIEGEEYVVGIVTGYLVDDQLRCTGPYIYEPLENLEDFIFCTTEVLPPKLQNRRCRGTSGSRGYKIEGQHIKWK